jgi:hypothetical protein
MEKTVQDIFVASAVLFIVIGILIYLGVVG